MVFKIKNGETIGNLDLENSVQCLRDEFCKINNCENLNGIYYNGDLVGAMRKYVLYKEGKIDYVWRIKGKKRSDAP